MLSNLLNMTKNYKEAPPGFGEVFFLFAYLIDAFCAKNNFPLMKWYSTPTQTPIHEYFY